MAACPSCGEDVADALSFCTQCGYRVAADVADERPAESVAELVSGRSLLEIIDEQAPLFWRRALELIEDLCGALANRDLVPLPDQIYVDHPPGGTRRIKLVDAAIEQMRGAAGEPRDTAVGTSYGTMIDKGRRKYGILAWGPEHAFTTPEQLMGKDVDHRTTVFVVGAIAYTLLTGERPFRADSPNNLITAMLRQAPRSPSELVTDLPPDVEHIVLRCLRKERDERFADVAALQRALTEVGQRTAKQLAPERARHTALERAIAEAPEDPDVYEVYGDWLQQQDDPRGHLIAMQLRAERATDPAVKQALESAAAAYLDANTAFLLGPLRGVIGVRDTVVRWRSGFIREVRLPRPNAPEALAQILGHPSGRFVSSIIVALRPDDLGRLIDVISRGLPATTRSFGIVSPASLVDLSAVCPHLERIRELHVTAPDIELGSLPPALHTLRLRTITVATARTIARLACPDLRVLELRIGRSPVTVSELWPLFCRTDLPCLEDIAITGWPLAGQLLRQLATGPLSRQLTRLDLSGPPLLDEQIGALRAQLHRLPSLRQLVATLDQVTDKTLGPVDVVDARDEWATVFDD